jgi:glycosyltransferase involved in cell wall biosynthesis
VPVPTVHFLVPGDLATATGGYRYARELVLASAHGGVDVRVVRLPDAFPFPSAADLDQAGRLLAAIPDGGVALIDGLAFGAMPALALAHRRRLALIALVHHPLALETGLTSVQAERLRRDEREALAAACAVVVTSPATGAVLTADYDVPRERISVIPPGTRRPRLPPASSPGAGGPGARERRLSLLCVATLTPRKGHADLIEALAAPGEGTLSGIDWRLVCAGADDRDPAHAAGLRARVAACGLTERVRFAGVLDDASLDEAYRTADVFVLASRHEGYGMVLAEAVAHGLPIVSTTAGAIPDTVPDGAGILVAPGDVLGLRRALSQVLGDDARRAAMAAAAAAAAGALPTWRDAAAALARLALAVGGAHRAGAAA